LPGSISQYVRLSGIVQDSAAVSWSWVTVEEE
jgi:hypothetical protein